MLYELLNCGLFLADDNSVAEEHRERLVADKGLRLEDCVTETFHFFLADEVDVCQVSNILYDVQKLGLSAFFKDVLQLGGAVEMIGDKALSACCNNQNVGDTGIYSLLNNVLNRRLVHYRKHFLRKALCGGQYSGSESRRRNNCFGNLHNVLLLILPL